MNKESGFIGVVLLAVAAVVGLSVVGMALNVITIPWLKLGSQVQMERDIVTKTYNADNAIYNYEWFKQRLEDIKAAETKIMNAKNSVSDFELSAGSRDKWTFEDKTEHARLSAVVLGLKNHYEEIVAEYNAKAKMANRNIFQDDLPLIFSLKPF